MWGLIYDGTILSSWHGKSSFEGATAFREILRNYPDTILLLNLRDRELWITSRLRHGHGEFAKREMAIRGLSTHDELADTWRSEWDTHINAVRGHMKNHPDQCVEFDLNRNTAEELASRLPQYRLNPADAQCQNPGGAYAPKVLSVSGPP